MNDPLEKSEQKEGDALSSIIANLNTLAPVVGEISSQVSDISHNMNTIWEAEAFQEIKEGIKALKSQQHELELVQRQMEANLQAIEQEQKRLEGQPEVLKAVQEEQNNLRHLVEVIVGTNLSDSLARQNGVNQKILTAMHRAEESRWLEWLLTVGLGVIAVVIGAIAVTKQPYDWWWLLVIVLALGLGLGLIFAQPAGIFARWIRERSNRSVGEV